MRREPLERRRAALEKVLRRALYGIAYSEHISEADPEFIFEWACEMGLEGIVSKRRGSPYVCGRSNHWLKSKNPASEAVQREAEEDWER